MKKKILQEIKNFHLYQIVFFWTWKFPKKNPDSTNSDELVTIINKDPLIVANILKVANSSMFGFRVKLETLSHYY